MNERNDDPVDLAAPAFLELTWRERAQAYADLRERSGMQHFAEPTVGGQVVGPGFYAATRFGDIEEISTNPQAWSSAAGTFQVQDLPREFLELYGSMINMDAPEHLRFRRLVSQAFTPRAVNESLEMVERIARETIDAVLEGPHEFDFVTQVAFPYPLRVMCELLGIPAELFPTICRHVELMTGGTDPRILGDRDPIAAFLEAGAAMVDLVSEIAQQRLATPADDIISRLAVGEVDGDRLTPTEIGSFFILLVAAGSETTRTSLSQGLIALDEFPDQRDRWMADVDGLTSTAVDEIIRWSSPVTFMRRTARERVRVGEQQFEPGDKVLMYYASANRDPSIFTDPDRLDLSRSPNPAISFGAGGPHFCLGAHLAKRELEVMFGQLLTRLPALRIAGEPELLRSDFLNGVVSLPVARS